MKHYLFNDRESGEDFIVGAETLEEAKEIARENFSQPHSSGAFRNLKPRTAALMNGKFLSFVAPDTGVLDFNSLKRKRLTKFKILGIIDLYKREGQLTKPEGTN